MADKIKRSVKIFLALAIIVAGVLGLAYGIQAKYQIIKTEASLEKNSDIAPADSVAIDFSLPLLQSGYADGIRIVPATAVSVRWENNRKLIITAQKNWQPGTNYQIFLPQSTTVFLAKMGGSKLEFSTVKYPQVTSVSPGDGATDALVDAESPIVVDFNKSTQGFFIKYVLNPENLMIYQNNLQKTEFKLLPKDPVVDGQPYDLKIFAKPANADDSSYTQIGESRFKTFSIADVVWEKDFSLRLAQARKYTRPKITAGKYIDINLAQQIMTTFEDGKLLDSYMVSSGKPGYETPPGNYKIENKTPRAWSKEFGLFMPWWNALVPSGKIGIHELPEWPGGYKEGAAHLGTPVSHGCVRLGVGPAKIVYDWAPIGTPVVVY